MVLVLGGSTFNHPVVYPLLLSHHLRYRRFQALLIMNEKPKVLFVGEVAFYHSDYRKGEAATLRALDHPVWGENIIHTSRVLQKFPDGSFETLNTIYKPVPNEI